MHHNYRSRTHRSARSCYNFVVDSRTLRLLELDKILSRLEAATACELGRGRVRVLKPTADTGEARFRLATTTEAKRFVGGKNPPFGGISDVAVFSAQRQHRLDSRASGALGGSFVSLVGRGVCANPILSTPPRRLSHSARDRDAHHAAFRYRERPFHDAIDEVD
jgi:hypothetical protein